MTNRIWITLVVGAGVFFAGGTVLAQDGVTAAMAFYSLDNIVLLFSAVLVLFMQAGFAALESGMSPLNNTVNIMFKNFTDLCVGVLFTPSNTAGRDILRIVGRRQMPIHIG
jgi:hypothetical protein